MIDSKTLDVVLQDYSILIAAARRYGTDCRLVRQYALLWCADIKATYTHMVSERERATGSRHVERRLGHGNDSPTYLAAVYA